MKKCALFLMCILFLASCSKKDQLIESKFSEDQQLEETIKEDFSTLTSSFRKIFSGREKQELIRFKEQLEDGANLVDLNIPFIADEFQPLQIRLADKLKSLSYYQDQNRLIDFLEEVGKEAANNKGSVSRAMGTPCYDTWDRQMAAVASSFLVCLGYSPNWAMASKCTIIAVIASVSTELAYQACIDEY